MSVVSQIKTKAIQFHIHVENKEQNIKKNRKQSHRYRDHFDSCKMGVELGERLKKYKLVITKELWGFQNAVWKCKRLLSSGVTL